MPPKQLRPIKQASFVSHVGRMLVRPVTIPQRQQSWYFLKRKLQISTQVSNAAWPSADLTKATAWAILRCAADAAAETFEKKMPAVATAQAREIYVLGPKEATALVDT
jgi:hypothetical protein